MSIKKRLYQKVLDKMLYLIDTGEYPVGGRLPPERELAERFEVSRPTVREAIIALEALERVEVRTGSGIYVLKSKSLTGYGGTDISAYELTEARALIEGEAVALAAELITEEELRELDESLREMARESEHGDLADGDADRKFHHVISMATRNAMLIKIIDHLWYVRNHAPQVFQAYKAICDTDGQARVEEHREIYDALKNRDPAASRFAGSLRRSGAGSPWTGWSRPTDHSLEGCFSAQLCMRAAPSVD
jgi:DNA-binding FadR family transcriptional regulator